MSIKILMLSIVSFFIPFIHNCCYDTDIEKKLEINMPPKSAIKNPEIVTQNSVVFIVLSQIDYDRLIKDNPAQKLGIIENMSDFESYSQQVAKKLVTYGIKNRYTTSKQIWFQFPDGEIEKHQFDPKDIYGMAVFAKDKRPKMISGFGAYDDPMLKIISEYFGIEIK